MQLLDPKFIEAVCQPGRGEQYSVEKTFCTAWLHGNDTLEKDKGRQVLSTDGACVFVYAHEWDMNGWGMAGNQAGQWFG